MRQERRSTVEFNEYSASHELAALLNAEGVTGTRWQREIPAAVRALVDWDESRPNMGFVALTNGRAAIYVTPGVWRPLHQPALSMQEHGGVVALIVQDNRAVQLCVIHGSTDPEVYERVYGNRDAAEAAFLFLVDAVDRNFKRHARLQKWLDGNLN